MKRTIIRISLVMLLGVVMSVAVAWGCAIWSDPVLDVTRYFSHEDAPRFGYNRMQGFGVTRMDLVGDNDMWYSEPTDHVRRAPYWSAARPQPSEHVILDPTGPWTIEFAYGWPARCVMSVGRKFLYTPSGSVAQPDVEVVSGVKVFEEHTNEPMPFRILPIIPIWPGLLANTAIYGSAWFAILYGPGMFIRGRRRRAGRCTKCGYDLRGSVSGECPECGVER